MKLRGSGERSWFVEKGGCGGNYNHTRIMHKISKIIKQMFKTLKKPTQLEIFIWFYDLFLSLNSTKIY